MALADDLRPILYTIRAIPGELGLRPYAVYVVTLKPLDNTRGGAKAEVVTRITEAGGQNPKVRWTDDENREVHRFSHGSVVIGPITPASGAAGTALATIKREDVRTERVYIRLVGPEFPNGEKFAITNIETQSALHYTISATHKAL